MLRLVLHNRKLTDSEPGLVGVSGGIHGDDDVARGGTTPCLWRAVLDVNCFPEAVIACQENRIRIDTVAQKIVPIFTYFQRSVQCGMLI
jgi:hypothetical protein